MKKSIIAKNRNLFVSYNISRLRELIRYLSEEKFDLFQTIPFFLHINMPGYPGYVETEEIFYGIYKFTNSGFYKYALKKFALEHEDQNKFDLDSPIIQGLYLMGSAGTLTQSDKSDFDYWVIIERKDLSESGFRLLIEKVRNIEKWCNEEYQQEVTFFIMDAGKIKENDFSVVDSESSGSAQKTLLKEEFYRTFIMLAGKIPFWAVLPSGISDSDYIDLVNFDEGETQNYIDTGNLVAIDPNECLGAVLWQVYKARNDPVKSLIKASLIAYYFFNSLQEESVICNILKDKFSEVKIEDHLFDPYTLVFEKIIQFYKEIDDLAGLKLIRKCILLRLLGYPLTSLPDLSSPKGKLLIQLAGEWRFDLDSLDSMKKFHTWYEEEKLDFENLVFDKLSYIYELILRSSDDLVKINMKEDDLSVLVNRTAAFRQKIDGKIAYASTFLRKKNTEIFFTVKESVTESGSYEWQVLGEAFSYQCSAKHLVYKSHEFIESVGWLVSNQFVKNDYSNVQIELDENVNHFTNPATSFQSIADFFNDFFPRPDHVYRSTRGSEGILFFLKNEKFSELNSFSSADYLLINSWGELYFDYIDLSLLESVAQKCYKIAITIFHLLQERPEYNFTYYICCPENVKDQSILSVISNFVDKMINGAEATEPDAIKQTAVPISVKKHKPFLDIL